MLYKTLKVSAGRHSFDIGQELEFSDAEAAELLADGAIAPLVQAVQSAPEQEAIKEPEADPVVQPASKTTKGKK